MAAQLYACAEAELGDFGDAFGRGDFSLLLEWFGESLPTRGLLSGIAPDRTCHGRAA